MPPKKKITIRSKSKKAVPKLKDIEETSKLYHNNGVISRVDLDGWILPSNKQFIDFIRNTFRNATQNQDRLNMKLWNKNDREYKDVAAYKHQKFVSDFISENTPYRGLLLYHGLGSGKSGASIMISEGLTKRHVVIMLPASLKDNYRHELQTFADISYKTNYNWKFINLDDITTEEIKNSYADKLQDKGLPKELFNKILKTHTRGRKKVKGIWMVQYDGSEPNYDNLSKTEQNEISEQIDIMFNYRYSLLHYNSGQYTITKLLEKLVPDYKTRLFDKLFSPDKKTSSLTNKDRDAMLDYIYRDDNDVENPFNNKVLVIDEIHNLTSGMVGSGYNGRRLYELIMRATNLKVIFLSGTPVINSAFELGLMFNMLKGITKSYSINLEKKLGMFKSQEIRDILEKEPSIDVFKIYEDRKVIELTRVPDGFSKRIGTDYVEKNPGMKCVSEEQFITSLLTKLSDLGYQRRGDISSNYYTLFPDLLNRRGSEGSMLGNKAENEVSQDIFNNNYINSNSLEVINKNQFRNRILGLISFYNEISKEKLSDPDIFPSKENASEEETTVTMSNFQFIEYAAKREIERKLEKRSAQFKSKKDAEVSGDMPSLFRVFSRQKGLFVFPPNIKRPMPPKKDDSIKNSIATTLEKDQVELISNSLRDILQASTGKEKLLEAYMDELDETERKVAEELIQNFYVKGQSGKEFSDWIQTYNFTEEDFMNMELPNTSDASEDDYYEMCRKAIDQLTPENLSVISSAEAGGQLTLHDLSPKYVKMIENINNSPGLVFCYSQFRSVEGIEIFGKILEANGYAVMTATSEKEIICDYTVTVGSRVRYEIRKDEWRTFVVREVKHDTVILNDIEEEIPIDKVFKCAYALWTGTESPEQRRAILDVYTSRDNMFGQKCMIFLTTQSGAEGISLFFVRQVHIMEPYWNNVRIEQVIGRSRRIKSHILLPEDQQNVKIFSYIIKYSESQLNGSWIEELSPEQIEFMKDGEDNGFEKTCDEDDDEGVCEFQDKSGEDQIKAFRAYAVKLSAEVNTADKGMTSDETLEDISTRKKRILDGFLTIMKEGAVDCQFNREDNIRSDPTIEEAFVCPTSIVSDGDKTYNILESDTNKKVKKQRREQSTVKEINTKKLSIPIIVNNSKIKVLIILPQSLNDVSKSELIKSLPDGLEIFDYYLYNSLYYKKKTQYGDKIVIGNIVNTPENPLQSKKQISKFVKLEEEIVKDYRRIESCIEKKGGLKIKTESKRIEWSDNIKLCHEETDNSLRSKKIHQETWKCLICEQETGEDICPTCGVTREDTMIFNDTSAPVQSADSKKEDSVSKKSVEKESVEEISAPEFKMPVVKKTDSLSDISDKKSAASAGSKDLDSKSDASSKKSVTTTKSSKVASSESTKSKKKKGRVKRARF